MANHQGVYGVPFTIAIGAMKIVPVPPDHEHAPLPGHANISIEAGVCYVLTNECPALMAMIKKLTRP